MPVTIYWGREFVLANETSTLLPLSGSKRGQLGWDRERFAPARARLIQAGFLVEVRPARFRPNRPAIYKLGHGVREFPQ
jgi:hypothetical protein